MEKDRQIPFLEAESRQFIMSYPQEDFNPYRSLAQALSRRSDKLVEEQQVDRVILTGPKTFKKDLNLIIRSYADSTLRRLIQAIYEGDPIPLQRHLLTVPTDAVFPKLDRLTGENIPYSLQSDYSPALVENFFVSAYERNLSRLEELKTCSSDTPHTFSEEAEFSNRLLSSHKTANTYQTTQLRGIIGTVDAELPDIIEPTLRQIIRTHKLTNIT